MAKFNAFTTLLILSCSLLSSPQIVSATPSANRNTSTQYFRHIMFRESPYASYRGIHPIAASNNPNVAHYEFDYDEKGRIKEISYQINDDMIHGNEVWDSFIWFAPKVKIDYRSDKEIHTYYNTEDQQISAHGNVYRAEYSLDEQGKRVALHFFDKDGQNAENAWNIHRYQWRTENNKVYEKRFNLNNEPQPMRPELQFYEVELEYDSDGKLAFMRNLGLEGRPTNNDSGAGIDRVVYDQEGNFSRWMVYDKDGNPIEGNRPMVHIGEHLYDQYGNKVGLRGFDRAGKRIPFSWGAFEHKHMYNQLGHQNGHIIYQADGSFDRHLVLEYNANNTQIGTLKSLNERGELTGSPMLGGAAVLQFEYNQEGARERKLFNADMSEFIPPANNSGEQGR